MKRILIYIATIVVTFICTSCNKTGYPIDGNTLVIINEYYIDENISVYTLQYEYTGAQGPGEPSSIIRMKYDRNAFEVGDTVKLVKVED